MTANSIVNWQLVRKLAKEIGVRDGAFRMWKSQRHIPHHARLALIQGSAGTITATDFERMDRARRRRASKEGVTAAGG